MNVGTVYVKDNGAVAADLRVITSGMVGASVRIVFDSTWEGYNKTLVWKAGDVTKDDTTASGVIPPEVLAVPGEQLVVGVYGVRDGVVTPTVYAKMGQILPGADPSGDESTDPTLPVWVQVQEDIERLETASAQAVEAAQQVTEAADAVKADAEQAADGAQLAGGYASQASSKATSAEKAANDAAQAAAEALGSKQAAEQSAAAAAESERRAAELVEDAGGEKEYELINTITVAADEDGSLPQHVIFSADSEGNAFELTDFIIKAYAGFVDGSKSTLYMKLNGTGRSVLNNGSINSISSSLRGFSIYFQADNTGCKRIEYTASGSGDILYNPALTIQESRLIPPMSDLAYPQITKIDLYTLVGDNKAWVEGSTFTLYGVRK
jgi:hypothetical protein